MSFLSSEDKYKLQVSFINREYVNPVLFWFTRGIIPGSVDVVLDCEIGSN